MTTFRDQYSFRKAPTPVTAAFLDKEHQTIQRAVDVNVAPRRVLLPNYTTAERDALAAVAGETVFNTTTAKVNTWDGAAWIVL